MPPLRPIEHLIDLQRKNTLAATKIQRAFRAYLRLQFWKLYFIKVRAAIQIQRIFRGALCRKFIRDWFLQRDFLAAKIQVGPNRAQQMASYVVVSRRLCADGSVGSSMRLYSDGKGAIVSLFNAV